MARRKLGFGAPGEREHFVVVQSDLVVGLETLLLAPLEDDAPMYQGDPLTVGVPAREAGTRSPQVVLAYLLTCATLDKFDQAPSGRLSARSMAEVDDAMRMALEL